MMYARRPLSRLRTDFSSTSPAVSAFWERRASRPASRAVCVATIRKTKAAASTTAAAVLNNSIRADRDFAIATGPARERLYWADRRGGGGWTGGGFPPPLPNLAPIVVGKIKSSHPPG